MLAVVKPVRSGAAGCIRPKPVESEYEAGAFSLTRFLSASGRIGQVIGDGFDVYLM
jgi:hypothetical protein